MKKIVWVYGIIAGLICAGWMFYATAIGDHTDLENGMFYGYASMVLAFSMIFVAVKNYRDKYLAGTISFGKAFRIGLLISLIASTIYVLTWEISFRFFVPDFMDKYTAMGIDNLKRTETNAAVLEAEIRKLRSFNEMYKNIFVRMLFSYAEIL